MGLFNGASESKINNKAAIRAIHGNLTCHISNLSAPVGLSSSSGALIASMDPPETRISTRQSGNLSRLHYCAVPGQPEISDEVMSVTEYMRLPGSAIV